MRFDIEGEKKTAKAIEYVKDGNKGEIALTENDLVFITNGSCTEGTIYGDQDHAPVGDAEVPISRRSVREIREPVKLLPAVL